MRHLRTYDSMLDMRVPLQDIQLLKSDELIVAGYASVELVDKQGDLITREALRDAFKKYMASPEYSNVQLAHSNIQVGSVISEYADSQGKVWKSEVDDVGMFVVVKLRDDIEKAREVASEIRKGNLRGFSIGGQAFKRMNKSDSKHGDYREISKLELHEVTICEKGINPESTFRIIKEDVSKGEHMTALDELSDVLNRLETRLDSMEKSDEVEKAPDFIEEVKEEAADEKDAKEEKKDEDKDDKKKSDDEFISEDYLNFLEGVAKSANYDVDKARAHFADPDSMEKAQLGGFDNPESVDGADYFAGQVKGRAQESGSPSTNAIKNMGLGGSDEMQAKKGFLSPSDVTDADIEKAYEVYKAAANEQQFKENLGGFFAERLAKENQEAQEAQARQSFDARGPLADITKAIESLSERIDNLSSESTTIQKSGGAPLSEVPIPETTELAGMSWSEVHDLANQVIRRE